MEKIRIGILGAADIAYRRFLPALAKVACFQFVGVAVADFREWGGQYNEALYAPLLDQKKEKAQQFIDLFGGRIFVGYENMLRSDEIDAVYIPLPPSLHYRWAYKALMLGKHVLSEKPCTVNLKNTIELTALAKEKGLAINENYAFTMHRQIVAIQELLREGTIGELRLIRSAFGFPHRNVADFRYDKKMGGGALLDCGGYVLKAAQLFLGGGVQVVTSVLHHTRDHDVDVYGSAVLMDGNGSEAQLAFGMDNSYKCELEIWGSKACILAPRVFTPPAEMEPQILIKGQSKEILKIAPDDQFMHAIEFFAACIENEEKRKRARNEILVQGRLIEEVETKRIGQNTKREKDE